MTSRSAVINLGIREKLKGGTQNKIKNTQKKLIWVEFLSEGSQGGYNFDLGVHRGKIFIWWWPVLGQSKGDA